MFRGFRVFRGFRLRGLSNKWARTGALNLLIDYLGLACLYP